MSFGEDRPVRRQSPIDMQSWGLKRKSLLSSEIFVGSEQASGQPAFGLSETNIGHNSLWHDGRIGYKYPSRHNTLGHKARSLCCLSGTATRKLPERLQAEETETSRPLRTFEWSAKEVLQEGFEYQESSIFSSPVAQGQSQRFFATHVADFLVEIFSRGPRPPIVIFRR